MKKLYFLVIALCFFSALKAQIINFPDAKFKAKLLAANTSTGFAQNSAGNDIKIDANDDGEVEVSEALNVYSLSVDSFSISDLTGIKSFQNLKILNCFQNNISNLDLTGLNNLVYLDCNKNALSSLNASVLTNLEELRCYGNGMWSLNIVGLKKLKILSYSNNNLSNLSLTAYTSLEELSCGFNSINNLNLSGLTNLKNLYCANNKLSVLDLTGLINLEKVHCYNNNLTSLKFVDSKKLYQLNCSYNSLVTLDLNSLAGSYPLDLDCSNNSPLVSLFIKNGRYTTYGGNPNLTNDVNLKYICVDDSAISNINAGLYYSGLYYNNIQINSYCSFLPGGSFYTIQGNNRWDTTSNGCDATDLIFPNLKFNITNGTASSSIISDKSGNYTIQVSDGTHTITPVLENPSYYYVSPASININFPSQTNPFIQNFCVRPNGIHPDLEITLLPIQRARPGFDAKYKIVFKNKGNIEQSGSVNLSFDDAVLDFVVSNPVITNQTTSTLSWSFANLLPSETREIAFTLNVNSPLETPAVNSGSILSYIATITSAATDETPTDNIFNFNQTVVNSFDPNDKTCLEGSIISPSLIGQYVHYMIRFENNGTANAQNIVVKDMIDLTKFDISTLVPTSASHSYITKISAGNKVEFIFENINLPFDDATNDGYIAFKIKTLPTLVVGNTFTNAASIYFDYNFPVVTKLASSTFKTLSTQDFEFSNYFTLYPNPAQSVLNISSKETIEVKSISIYTTLGQLVLVIPNAEKVSKIDVSGLTSGNYFIKINSDRGTSNTRFIKE